MLNSRLLRVSLAKAQYYYFVLSYDVTGLCAVGDVRILPLVLQACENFRPMDIAEREKMIAEGRHFEPLFA